MFQRRPIRDALLLLAAPFFAMASSVPDVVAYEPKFIYYACGHDMDTMQQCLASAERWEEEKEETAFDDYRVVVLPRPFSSREILTAYLHDFEKIKRDVKKITGDVEKIKVDDFTIDVMLVDTVHIPVLASPAEGQCDPPENAVPTQRSGAKSAGLRLLELTREELKNKYIRGVKLVDFLDSRLKGQIPAVKDAATIGDSVYALPFLADIPLIYINTDLVSSQNVSLDQGWSQFLKDVLKVHEDNRTDDNDGMNVVYSFQTAHNEAVVAAFFDLVFEVEGKHKGFLQEYKNILKKYNNDCNQSDAVSNFTRLIDRVFQSEEFKAKMGSLRKIAQFNKIRRHSNVTEEESLDLFAEGKVCFMRNWPFAFPRLKKQWTEREFEIKLLPGTLGGWYVAVNECVIRNSEKLDAVLDFIFFVSGRIEQKERLREEAALPTFIDLYDKSAYKTDSWEKTILSKLPPETLNERTRRWVHVQNAIERPAKIYGDKYGQVSTNLAAALADFFNSDEEEEAALNSFKRSAQKAFQGGDLHSSRPCGRI